MKAHVILEFEDTQAYQQAMWNIFDSIPLLVDWEEVAVYSDEEEEEEE